MGCNKLANNVALGWDAAGVHYRSDSINGLFVGEEQALGLLCDYSRTYKERFDGFLLSTFRGKKVGTVNGESLALEPHQTAYRARRRRQTTEGSDKPEVRGADDNGAATCISKLDDVEHRTREKIRGKQVPGLDLENFCADR